MEAGEEWSLVVGGAGRVWPLGSEAGRVWSQPVAGWVWSLGSEAGRMWSQLVVGGAGWVWSQLVVGGAGDLILLELSCHCPVAL